MEEAMTKPRTVKIRQGPASKYVNAGESIYEFSDGKSGGLILFSRDDGGRLIVDLYNMDDDVFVRVPRDRVTITSTENSRGML
jgi:hypothetical protein